MADISINMSGLDNLLTAIEGIPGGVGKAGSRAINRSLTTVRAAMVKSVVKDYEMTAKDVRKTLKFKKANYKNLFGQVIGSGSPGVPLKNFVTIDTTKPSTVRLESGKFIPPVGIPVKIKKSGGKKVVKGLFIAVMPSGHKGAFRRVGKKRLKIEEMYGPSPIAILSGTRYDNEIDEIATESLKKNLLHEAEFMLRSL